MFRSKLAGFTSRASKSRPKKCSVTHSRAYAIHFAHSPAFIISTLVYTMRNESTLLAIQLFITDLTPAICVCVCSRIAYKTFWQGPRLSGVRNVQTFVTIPYLDYLYSCQNVGDSVAGYKATGNVASDLLGRDQLLPTIDDLLETTTQCSSSWETDIPPL